jgi:hypothetical protein
MGKSIDKRLAELGATRFYRSEWVDEATGTDCRQQRQASLCAT